MMVDVSEPPRRRFYLGAEGTEPPAPAPGPPRPRPGHGTVFVRSLDGDTWTASWQDGPREEDFEGSRADVVRWALSRPAVRHLVFSPSADDYLPLEPGP